MADLDAILPVVLVGGQSRRFGRDKLMEPIPGSRGTVLVDVAIGALREVFGARVRVCGRCGAAAAARADGVIEDVHPGAGPLGGIASALRAGGAVFVLSGDLPGIDAGAVRRVLAAADARPSAMAVVAKTDRLHPCIGLYRAACAAGFESALAEARRSLVEALGALGPGLATCEISPRAAANVNTPDEFEDHFRIG